MTTTTLNPVNMVKHAFIHIGIELTILAVIFCAILVLVAYLWSKRPSRGHK